MFGDMGGNGRRDGREGVLAVWRKSLLRAKSAFDWTGVLNGNMAEGLFHRAS